MENIRDSLLVVFSFALLFTFFFHKQYLGLNLFFAEIILMVWLVATKQFKFKGLYAITLGAGFVVTSLFTVLTHSIFSYVVNYLVLFTLVGYLTYPKTKSLLTSLGLAISNFFEAQINFLKKIAESKMKGKNVGTYIWKSRIFFIPLLIIFIFIIIYRFSNPVFNELVIDASDYIIDKLNTVFKHFDFTIIFTFLVSLILCIFIFIRKSDHWLLELDKGSSDDLKRYRKKHNNMFGLNALKNEYRAGLFLLIILNVILLIVNIIDINWVWFGFEWEGQYLKQFVHQGTYLLILSILISIALVLYYFRGTINFYKENKVLKILSYVWLTQNAILTISVAVRNFWYISYFALAYKRIGVIIFLILTIYGLYSVYMKVRKRKSSFYLFRTNTYTLLLILIISSIINWDTIIAKYNFRNYKQSFLHLNYMSTLSDKTLPYLDKSLEELNEINVVQSEEFHFDRTYMSPKQYYDIIETRKLQFKMRWDTVNFLSWNYAEYVAYKKLMGECTDQ